MNPADRPAQAARAVSAAGVLMLALATAYLVASLRANDARDAASIRDRADLHRELDQTQAVLMSIHEAVGDLLEESAAGRAEARAAQRRAQEALDRMGPPPPVPETTD